MNGRNSASAKAGVQDWVDSNFFEQTEKPGPSMPRSPFDLQDGCEVREFDDNDTIPAEFDFLLK